MFLSLRNLGKIKTADIEINAITVIAGENNTGKSTVGKTLFCIFNSFYRIDSQIETGRLSFVNKSVLSIYRNASDRLISRRIDYEDFTKSIIANKDMYVNNELLLQQDIRDFLIQNDPGFERHNEKVKLDGVAEDIKHILDISDYEILVFILQKKMQAEFNMQINNIFDAVKVSEIKLKIKDTEINIRVENNDDIEISDAIKLNTEVIYIDDPYSMDNLRYSILQTSPNNSFLNHREHLTMCLEGRKSVISVKEALDEIVISKKLDKVFEKLNSVCPGKTVKKNNRSFAYMENSNTMIDMVNVSTGLKTFAIIKTLLLNGCLEENGTIILDEPEIHLHPEWQLVLAELIVLIQKEFSMHILLNTHSPYFLDAIEVYSHKHGIADKCKYYLAEASGTMSVITDVSENIELIYAKLARPLQVLENERYA